MQLFIKPVSLFRHLRSSHTHAVSVIDQRSSPPAYFRRPTRVSCNVNPVNMTVTNEQTTAKLVSPQWLFNALSNGGNADLVSSHGNDQSVTILDVRGRVVKTEGRVTDGFQPVQYVSDKNAFLDDGHIPNASFIDWRHIDLWRPNELLDELSEHGVQRDGTICIYDWGDMLFATRLWLALISLGCTDVRILNGGWKAWMQKFSDYISYDTACPLTLYREFCSEQDEQNSNGSIMSRVEKFSVKLDEMKNIVEKNLVTSTIERDSLIVDARSSKLFNGVERRAESAGHIPTAVSLPYRQLLNDDGTGLKSDMELKKILKNLVSSDKNAQFSQVVCYCNGGVASSLVFFCLTRCGHQDEYAIRNYCASFNEWGNIGLQTQSNVSIPKGTATENNGTEDDVQNLVAYQKWIKTEQAQRNSNGNNTSSTMGVEMIREATEDTEMPPDFNHMSLFQPGAEEYALDMTTLSSTDFLDVATATHDAGLFAPCMVGKLEGQFLKMMTQIKSAKRVLDIGTFTGYSALAFAEGLEGDGEVVTLEADKTTAEVAGDVFKKAKSGNKIKLIVCDAQKQVVKMANDGEEFDIVFLDADKVNYQHYYEWGLKMLKRDGILMADNALCSLVFDKEDPALKPLHDFAQFVRADDRVEQVMLTVREGILVVRKV